MLLARPADASCEYSTN